VKHYAHPLQLVAEHLHTKGVPDYLDRAAQFQHEAEQKTPSDNVFTAQSLREVSHLHELARECQDLAGTCMTMAQRATMRAYQHRQLVAVSCATAARQQAEKRSTYREQIARNTRLTGIKTNCNAPPGQLVTLSPIATCAASNAPGVVRPQLMKRVMATT
jgi:hypothetical protein